MFDQSNDPSPNAVNTVTIILNCYYFKKNTHYIIRIGQNMMTKHNTKNVMT
jgi:hypothetical protein